MTKPPASLPRSDRAAREAAALRANLLKRKDQARQREAAKQPDAEIKSSKDQPPKADDSPPVRASMTTPDVV